MAKMQVECGNCAKKFWVNKIKVFVFKLRYCPDCNIPMFCDNEKKTFTCPKCKQVIQVNALKNMKTEIKGTSRDFKERDRYMIKGYEVQKLEMPEKRVCVRCKALRIHIQHILNEDPNFTPSVLRELNKMSDIEFLETFFKHVQGQMRKNLAANPKIVKKIEQKSIDKNVIVD